MISYIAPANSPFLVRIRYTIHHRNRCLPRRKQHISSSNPSLDAAFSPHLPIVSPISQPWLAFCGHSLCRLIICPSLLIYSSIPHSMHVIEHIFLNALYNRLVVFTMTHETRHEWFDYDGCILLLVQEKHDEMRVFQDPAQKAGRRDFLKAWQRFWTHINTSSCFSANIINMQATIWILLEAPL